VRLLLAAGLVLLLPSLPYGFRGTLLPNASPRMLAWFGSATLVGIAAGFTGLLGTLVAPGPLPLPDLPRAVEVCFDAAGRLLSHPLKHWPSILAASILLLPPTGDEPRPGGDRGPGALSPNAVSSPGR